MGKVDFPDKSVPEGSHKSKDETFSVTGKLQSFLFDSIIVAIQRQSLVLLIPKSNEMVSDDLYYSVSDN